MRPYREVRFKGAGEEVNAQWLEARKNGLGGSDAAAVLGMSKYATPLTVWLEKTGRSDPPGLSGNEKVYWGTVLEDVVAKEFAKRHPDMRVRRLNAMLWSVEHPFMFASVDRVLADSNGKRGILEIKTADKRLAEDWEEGVPDYYVPQPTHYLAVTGFDFYAVAVLVGGNAYKDFVFERDEDDVAVLIEREESFWRGYVETDTPPAVVASAADADALLEMHSEPDEEFVEMLDQDVPQIAELIEIGEKEKELKERKLLVSNELKRIIGDSKGIRTATAKVSWPRFSKQVFDEKRFREEYPEIYSQFVTEKPSQGGLRPTEVK